MRKGAGVLRERADYGSMVPAVLGARRIAIRELIAAMSPDVRRTLNRTIDRVPAVARARDTWVLRERMRRALGYEPDFRNPRTYNEKIACKILHDRSPLIRLTADKVSVRDYVAAKIGPDILVPLIGVYERTADVPWDGLPERFVVKASHGSGMVIPVPCKARADRQAILNQAEVWLSQNYYERSRAWGHRGIRPRILIEQMLAGPDGSIPEDYKFYVFNGRPRILEVHLDRFGKHQFLNYDPVDLRPLPFRSRNGGILPEQTSYAPEAGARGLADIAAQLGKDFAHVRVDLYFVGGRAWFGELTHYSGNACDPFDPPEYDRIVGDMWTGPVPPHPSTAKAEQTLQGQ